MNSELFVKVSQREERVDRIKAFLIFPVATFHLAIKDKGFSGKNTDRPRFQELMADIKRGLIRRVVVYKLDRISRSILDFATMMELFQQYNVEFVSSTEKFDTSTPMGRAMLNICIVFAISWCRKSPGRWPGVCSREAEKSTGQPSKYRSWRSRAGKSSCLRAAG